MRTAKKSTKTMVTKQEVYATLRLKAYQFYLKHYGENKDICSFEEWFKKKKIYADFWGGDDGITHIKKR